MPPAIMFDNDCMFTVAAVVEAIDSAAPACSFDDKPKVSADPSIARFVSAENRHKEDAAETLLPEIVNAPCVSI